MDITYKVSPTFAKVHRDKSQYLFVRGPVSSGKSTGCMMHLFMNALKQLPDENGVRHSHQLVIRATYPELKATTIKTWIKWFKDKLKLVYDTPIRGELKYDLADGTSVDMKITFLAVQSELDVEKLRSLEVTSCHINEASEIDFEIFDMVKTRINRYPDMKDYTHLYEDLESACIEPQVIMDYNSVSTDHWLYKLAEEKKPEGHSFYTQPPAVFFVDGRYVVNPEAENLEFNNKGYYENMCLGMDPDFLYVNVMNNYGEVRAGRPVYKDYSDNVHCVSEELKPVKGVQLVIGVDQGLTPAAVFTQMTPDGTVMVFDEIVTKDCSLQEFCNELLWPLIKTKYPDFVKNYVVVCDPATTQRSMNDKKAGTDILRDCGIVYKTAKTNVFTTRKEAVVHFLLLKDKFKLSDKCKIVRKGFINGYKFDEIRSSQSDLYKENPAKNEFSHPHDALQYAMMEYYAQNHRRKHTFTRRKHTIASSIGGY